MKIFINTTQPDLQANFKAKTKKIKMTTTVMAVSVFLGVFAGCASVGNEALRNESEGSVSTKIVEGTSTRESVKASFGSPSAITFTDAGLEVWTYSFKNDIADPINFIPFVNWLGTSSSTTKKDLVVLFNANHVVQRFTMNEAKSKTKTGLFNQ